MSYTSEARRCGSQASSSVWGAHPPRSDPSGRITLPTGQRGASFRAHDGRGMSRTIHPSGLPGDPSAGAVALYYALGR
jgi:hypothetical protein